MKLHRTIRQSLSLDTALFSVSGSFAPVDVPTIRRFAYDLERQRRGTGHPDPAVRSGDIVALGILDELAHHVIALSRSQTGKNPGSSALALLEERVGQEVTDDYLREFCLEFPPAAVQNGRETVEHFLSSTVEGLTGRERAIEQFVVLQVTNENPATRRYGELFDTSALREHPAHSAVLQAAERAYGQPASNNGASGDAALGTTPAADLLGATPLLSLLREPARRHPDSLEQQLQYVREHWQAIIEPLLERLLRSIDVVREETRERPGPGAGPPPAQVYTFNGEDEKRFSPDTDWMPGVVMMAKSTLVWLFQLSGRYGRDITRLDQIPDAEIDRLAAAGFNAIWLIGLWERSPASRRIKHLTGNPEAEASAYALYSYDIAAELGGWQALSHLRDQCTRRGIRLASDMVPNHTGIDSPWVAEHPDWFVSVDESPFPAYSFTGENLSGRENIQVTLEDHYFDQSDAAVVFRHADGSGRTRYIYHGNDGTSMPWNDTAQLNYLNPEVRETVIQTILHVARNFPVIRFDAAMTLARKHVRRLWFPEPGSGGDIASRAEHGLSDEEFFQAMPKEFWREVVDRVAQEAPDTLLLAEAFWMMEGYFVRTLGMHRVYNSAFMNMLKREQNSEYRQIIKNTLAFDPEILKRFVNFMNNPDEETAVTQFGTGDKYFAVATLLATLPGLPMFGHGQIEGLAEKYGMEFRRPYWDETPDEDIIARHDREIFPLLRDRERFASAGRFRLYDVHAADGGVAESVFAYSNAGGHGSAVLVVVNNAYESVSGTVTLSVPFAPGDQVSHICDELGIPGSGDRFLVCREQRSSFWYLRRCDKVRSDGWQIRLDGYESRVYLDMEIREDGDGSLAELARELGGAGVPDLDRALAGRGLLPVADAVLALATPEEARRFQEAMMGLRSVHEFMAPLIARQRTVLDAAERCAEVTPLEGRSMVLRRFERVVAGLTTIPHAATGRNTKPEVRSARGRYFNGLRRGTERQELLMSWALLQPLAARYGVPQILEWGASSWLQLNAHPRYLRLVLRHAGWWKEAAGEEEFLALILADPEARECAGVNTHSGVDYYHVESMAEVIWSLFAAGYVDLTCSLPSGGQTAEVALVSMEQTVAGMERLLEGAHGKLDLLREATQSGSTTGTEQPQAGRGLGAPDPARGAQSPPADR